MTVSTSQIAINGTTWTDLGTGPLEFQDSNVQDTIGYAFSDSEPTGTEAEFVVTGGATVKASTASHVWAILISGQRADLTITSTTTATSTPVAGTFSGTGPSAPFTPVGSDPISAVLSFVGATATVRLEAYADATTGWQPVINLSTGNSYTFTGSGFSAFSGLPRDATYRLNCLTISAGTVNYRLSQ